MACELLLTACLTVLGPATFAAADPGVLETVAERRISAGWGLDSIEGYTVLIAPADCALLGRSGWLIANGDVYQTIVVDCEQKAHKGQMAERGLLADVNDERLNHLEGWLVLR